MKNLIVLETNGFHQELMPEAVLGIEEPGNGRLLVIVPWGKLEIAPENQKKVRDWWMWREFEQEGLT